MTPLLENRRFPLSQHTNGPFFPADYFQPGDNDLTRVSPSANPCSTGEPFTLTGAVRKEGSEPVANAIPLRANKRETTDWLKFTLEGAGERTHGYAFTDTTFAGCWI